MMKNTSIHSLTFAKDILLPLTLLVNPITLKLMPTLRLKHGFTLVELLLTIALIGILSGMISTVFISAQKKARDGQRKSDLNQIKKALEAAKQDCTSSSYYPVTSGVDQFTRFTNLKTYLSNSNLKYMLTVPEDPQNNGAFRYAYWVYTSGAASDFANNVCPDTSLNRTQNGSKDFLLRVGLEITQDRDSARSITKCGTQIANFGLGILDISNYYFVCND